MLAPGGAFYNYSNPNFSLAGLATELAAGRPWARLVEEDLFAPLGMSRSFATLAEVVADGNVGNSIGYSDFVGDPASWLAPSSFQYGEVAVDGLSDNAFTRPAGLVWSTAADQARLLGFLVDGDPAVLDPALLDSLTSPQVPMYPALPDQFYGYGLFLYNGFFLPDGYYPTPLWAHGGNTLTYTSASYVLPDQRFAFSILSNGYGDAFNETLVALLDLVEIGAPGSPPVTTAGETDLALLIGRYVDPLIGEMLVTREGPTLTLELPTLEAMGFDGLATLEFVGGDDYLFTTTELGTQELTFIQDQDGVYRWARNRLFVGTRSEDQGPPARIAGPAPTADALRAWIALHPPDPTRVALGFEPAVRR